MSKAPPVPRSPRALATAKAASACVLAAYGAVVLLPAARHPGTHGFAAYYAASRVLLAHATDLPRVYDDAWFQGQIDADGFEHVRDIYNVQPPTMALLLVPFAWLSPRSARAAWLAASALLWLVGCASLARTLGGGPARARAAFVAALTVAFLPLRDNFRQGQCYALLFALLALHFELSLRRTPRARGAAGVPLGIMLILKQAGLWVWLLLLLARQWRVVLVAAGTCLAVALAASPVIGWDSWRPFLAALPGLARDPTRSVSAYQTVAGLFSHLFTLDATWNRQPVASWRRAASLATALVTVLAIVQSLRAARLDGAPREARLLTLAMFAALGVTVTPFAESYHYCLVLPSLAVAWWWAWRTGARVQGWLLLGAATLLLTVTQRVYGSASIQAGWAAVLAYPRVYGAFLLWAWLARAVDLLPRAPDVATP